MLAAEAEAYGRLLATATTAIRWTADEREERAA
jgi:hypothetical protein